MTGVQTCALPILPKKNLRLGLIEFVKGEDLKNKSLEFFFGNDKS